MFVTKQILNEKQKKLMLPHKRQIMNEIKASIEDEDRKISRFSLASRPKSCKNRNLRPRTSNSFSELNRPASRSNHRINTEEKQNRSSSFIKKINYQFKQIKEITSLFDNFFNLKQKKQEDGKTYFSEKVQNLKKKISLKEKQQKLNFQKMKRNTFVKTTQVQANIYLGYPKQKAQKTISASIAKNQDINLITRCIKGGYVDDTDEFSENVNKSQLIKLKKKFITFNSLYDNVKGKKSKGIQNITPQNIDRNSFKNYVYYFQNEKNFKIADKLAIQQKIKLIS